MPVKSSAARRDGTIAIVPWKEEDLPAVRQIAWETWKATYGAFIPVEDMRAYHEEHYSLAALGTLLKAPSARGFLARWETVPVGYMVMALLPEKGRCSISSIYVLPAFHGRGAGGLLMEEARRVARTNGFDRIWLGVMEKNSATIGWYRRLGFRFPEHAPFQMGATVVNHLIGYMNIH